MKVFGLDGRTYQWKWHDKEPAMNDNDNRSAGHLRARLLLRAMFPHDTRLEEVSLPGSRGLTADFVLPRQKLLVEVHGRQHYEFVPRFHKTRYGFIEAVKRDRNKREWAELNEFIYCELPDTESDGQWQSRIQDSEHSRTSGEDCSVDE